MCPTGTGGNQTSDKIMKNLLLSRVDSHSMHILIFLIPFLLLDRTLGGNYFFFLYCVYDSIPLLVMPLFYELHFPL